MPNGIRELMDAHERHDDALEAAGMIPADVLASRRRARPPATEAIRLHAREIAALYALRQVAPAHVGRPAGGDLIVVADSDGRVWAIDDAGVTTRLS